MNQNKAEQSPQKNKKFVTKVLKSTVCKLQAKAYVWTDKKLKQELRESLVKNFENM